MNSKRFLLPYLLAAVYFFAAYVALHLTKAEDGIAAVWPASGVFIAGLLCLDRPGRKHLTIGVALASFLGNMLGHVPPLTAIGFTIANLIEGYIVFYLMGSSRRQPRLSAPLNMLRFGGASIVAGLASTLMAGLLTTNFDTSFLLSWFSTVTLGMLIVTPVFIFLAEDPAGRKNLFSLTGLWMALLMVALSFAAFAQVQAPMLFLPVVGISIVTLTLGISGTAVALLLVAVIGSVLTVLGIGPLPGYFATTPEQVLYFQLYLVALLVSALPLTTLLEQRKRALIALDYNKRMLESAECAAGLGHWHYRISDRSTYWSKEARRLCQIPGESDPDLFEALDIYHEDDRERVRALTFQAMTSGIPFVFEARIPYTDGGVRHIEGRGMAEEDATGQITAIFGTILDVTERVEAIQDAIAMRTQAELEADKVRHMAETDPLTGLPNRRKVLDDLEAHTRLAFAGEQRLSLAMIDIDRFKSINDEFGHAAGDRALKVVADLIHRQLRTGETVGRIGGEEFLLLLPGSTVGEAVERAEQCRAAVAAHDWANEGFGRVTLSIGVAGWKSGDTVQDLLRAADVALYGAKGRGRDRTNSQA